MCQIYTQKGAFDSQHPVYCFHFAVKLALRLLFLFARLLVTGELDLRSFQTFILAQPVLSSNGTGNCFMRRSSCLKTSPVVTNQKIISHTTQHLSCKWMEHWTSGIHRRTWSETCAFVQNLAGKIKRNIATIAAPAIIMKAVGGYMPVTLQHFLSHRIIKLKFYLHVFNRLII